jgi:PAS domain S-box-containing protein
MMFLLKGSSAPGAIACPRSNSATTLRSLLASRAAGYTDITLEADARLDPRFCENRLVREAPFIRFYAGAPIQLRSGHVMGTVCIIDRAPRLYDPQIAEVLTLLAAQAAEEMEALASIGAIHGFIDNAPAALVMTDADLRVLRVSTAWSEQYGLTADKVLGRTMSDVLPDGSDQWRGVYERALSGAVERGVARSTYATLGPERWFKWTVAPWRDAVGRIGGLFLNNSDVTDLILGQEASLRDAQRLKMAVDISRLLVWEYDSTSDAVTWTGDVSHYFDTAPQGAAIADGDFRWAHPDDRAALAAQFAASGDDKVFRREFRLVRADGRIQWVSAKQQTLHAPSGAVRAIGVIRDVTESKLDQLAIIEARQAAERASEAKSQFLANMSHEIRTPLNGVLGVISALARSGLDEDQRAMVEIVERSGQAVNTLLSDLLDVSRIEAGQLNLTNSDFDLALMIADLADLFAPMAVEKDLDLIIPRPIAAIWVHGDAIRLRQILSNLISNALKFTDQGRVVLEFSEPDRSGICRFVVRDTGIGFAPESAEKLFDRFYQADGSITRRFGGTGLGLAISRDLAQMMSGSLVAEAADQGSVFTLTVKLPGASAPDLISAAVDDGPDESAMRILLAEDNAVNQQVVRLILEQVGAAVTIVENGLEAVRTVSGASFDLILMDMQMPVMGGLEAIRQIRAEELRHGLQRTPIYTLSANALEEHRRAALAAGADDHLTKPVTAATLIGAVATAASRADDDLIDQATLQS